MPTRLSQLIRRAAADGRVEPSEAQALVDEALKVEGRLPAEDRRSLLALLESSRFEPHALAKLQAVLGVTGGRVDLPDPAPMKADAPVQYRDVIGGQLFVDGLHYDDVVQGSAGDCYFLSSVMSVAVSTPALLEEAIRQNPDGTYTVRFFQKVKGNREPQPVYETVDGQLAHGEDGVTYATSRTATELWPALFEKAFAQRHGGYHHIGEGGVAEKALFALTGRKSTWFDRVASVDAEELWRTLSVAAESKRPMVTSTRDRDYKKRYADAGLQKQHSYALVRVLERNGERYVQLRDPHAGELEWGHGADGKADGNFEMTYAEWRKQFADLFILR